MENTAFGILLYGILGFCLGRLGFYLFMILKEFFTKKYYHSDKFLKK